MSPRGSTNASLSNRRTAGKTVRWGECYAVSILDAQVASTDDAEGDATFSECTQCGKPAVVNHGGHPLCVDHHLRMQQAGYLAGSMITAQLNRISEDISHAMGGLVPPIKMEIPRPPFVGDTFTLNNINVSNSTIGAINTGTVQNLDASITLLESVEKRALASAVKDFAQELIDNPELAASIKDEVAEQLELVLSQVQAKADERRAGTIKSVLSGIRSSVGAVASLVATWDKLEPLLRSEVLG